MSMILDAMKRSKEGGTKSSGLPTVDTVHYVPQPESRFSRWQIGGLVAGVLVSIVALIVGLQPFADLGQASQVPLSEGQSPTTEVKQSGRQSSQGQRAEVQSFSERTIAPNTSRPIPDADSTPTQDQMSGPKNGEDLTSARFAKSNPQKARSRALEVEQREVAGTAVAIGTAPVATRSSNAFSSLSAQRLGASTEPADADELQAIYRALNEEANRAVDENPARSFQTRSSEDIASPLTGVIGAGNGVRDSGLDGVNDSLVESGVSGVSTREDEGRQIDFAEILAAAQEDLGVKPLVESAEPLLETLSQQIKNEIPTLIYSDHAYEPVGSSSVTLNGKLLRERQRVGAFTVVEILPDSVVLRWRESQFRVRARNSWVNL